MFTLTLKNSRLVKVSSTIIFPILLLLFTIYILPEAGPAQAAPIEYPSLQVITSVKHTAATPHEMNVFGNGKLSDQFLSDDGNQTNQIHQPAAGIPATTIAVTFAEHNGDIDSGVHDEFDIVTPISLNENSTTPNFDEETYAVYESKSLAYQISQRTLAADADNCVLMELVVENRGDEPLTGGRLLYMIDINAAQAPRGDIGVYNPQYQLVYHKDEIPDTGYGMGMALLEGELIGYNILLDSQIPEWESDPTITTDLKDPDVAFESAKAGTNQNLVSLLVAEIPDLGFGDTEALTFGLCARSVSGSQDDAGTALEDSFDSIDPMIPDPVVSFSSNSYQVQESAGPAVITVELSHPSRYPVFVNYNSTDSTKDGDATEGEDYIAASGEVHFDPFSTTATFPVTIIPDTISEISETVKLVLSTPISATLGNNSTILTILDDSDEPDLSIDNVEVIEGDDGETTEMIFTVSLSPPSARTVTVDYQTTPYTGTSPATSPGDYVSHSGRLTFAAGVTSQPVTITVNGDNIDEEYEERLFVDLTAPTNAGITKERGVGTILDDDATISITENITVTEGNSGEVEAVFEVTLANRNAVDVFVDYSTADDTATEPDDYEARSGTLTFAKDTNDPQFITVPVKGDDLDEDDEVFFVNLTNPANADLDDNQRIVTISDDDRTSLSIDDVEVFEGDEGTTTEAVFTVSLSTPSAKEISVQYETVNGTAIAPADYISEIGTLTFPAENTASKTITVTVKGDDLEEELEEFFYVRLTKLVNGEFEGGQSVITGTGTITDDDRATLSINDADVVEGDSGTIEAIFTVSLLNRSTEDITVKYHTEDGSAKISDNDYITETGTLTFPAEGRASQTITVTVNGDLFEEGVKEVFYVKLTEPMNAIISDGEGIGTIRGDEFGIRLPVVFRNYSPPPCHIETFDGPTGDHDIDWLISSAESGTIRSYTQEREYQIFSQTKQGGHWSRSPKGFFTDYVIRVKAHWGGGGIGSEYGLIFDRSGANDETEKMYRFNINTIEKTYILSVLENNNWTDLRTGSCPQIKIDLEDNLLEVRRQGDRIDTSINGTCPDGDDHTLNNRPARVGLNVRPIKDIQDGDGRFDNFMICSHELEPVSPLTSQAIDLQGGITP